MAIEELATEPNEAPPRRNRAGCLAALVGVAAAACVLGYGALSWLNDGKPQPPALLSPNQVDQLQLSGTWRNADGATLTFSYHPVMSGMEQGTVDAANLPSSFTHETGAPFSSGQGYWTPGSVGDSPEGIVVYIPASQADTTPVHIALFPAGNPASPTLDCDTTSSSGECVFVKQQ